MLGDNDSIRWTVIVVVAIRGDTQLNTSETSKIRTRSVSAKLEDPDEFLKCLMSLCKLANNLQDVSIIRKC